jgi:hypothetical protein
MRSPRFFLLPLAFALAAPVQAQTSPDSGAVVRIRSPELSSGRTSGVLQRVTADSMLVSGQSVSRSSVSRMDVSTGRKSHLLMGMGIGFVSGAAVGALGLRLTSGTGSNEDEEMANILTAVGAGAGGLVGLGIGAAIGSKKTEQWRTSSLSTLRITPVARANGGVGFSLGFRF